MESVIQAMMRQTQLHQFHSKSTNSRRCRQDGGDTLDKRHRHDPHQFLSETVNSRRSRRGRRRYICADRRYKGRLWLPFLQDFPPRCLAIGEVLFRDVDVFDVSRVLNGFAVVRVCVDQGCEGDGLLVSKDF